MTKCRWCRKEITEINLGKQLVKDFEDSWYCYPKCYKIAKEIYYERIAIGLGISIPKKKEVVK